MLRSAVVAVCVAALAAPFAAAAPLDQQQRRQQQQQQQQHAALRERSLQPEPETYDSYTSPSHPLTYLETYVAESEPAPAAAPESSQPKYRAGRQVDTTIGPVVGRPAAGVAGVSEYLGIPYALPPLDLLRFHTPVARNRSKEVFRATTTPSLCPGFDLGSEEAWEHLRTTDLERDGVENQVTLGLQDVEVDEDCLTLSIWTKPQDGEGRKAVLVWLHDGGLSFGRTTDIFEEAQYIADREDVVVVSVNSRLSIFGFSGAPKLPQNVGLHDQRMAVEWVRDNIANFGGDPARITLVGQSASGASVDYYSFAYHARDPIVNAFIQESGTVFGMGPMTPEVAAETWYQATMKTGCGSVTSSQKTLLACMRFVSFDNILAAISGPPGRESIISPLRFGPVVDGDLVFSNYRERAAAGLFTKRPLMIGTADDDEGVAAPFGEARGQSAPAEVVRYISLSLFDCPVRDRAAASAAAGATTFRYRQFGSLASAAFSYSFKPRPWMTEERWDDVPEGTPEELKAAFIGRWVRGAWAAFAKEPVNALRGNDYGWPTYEPGTGAPGKLSQLQFEGRKGANEVQAPRWDERCRGIEPPGTLRGVLESVETVL